MKGISILGSTGSIGQNCLRVIRALPGRFRVVSLSAGKNVAVLAGQIREFRPRVVALRDTGSAAALRERLRTHGYRRPLKVLLGTEGQVEAVSRHDVDFVVSASHGITGLVATLAAVEAGKQLGLANKETLVVAGELLTRAARRRGLEVLPIDSEHSALHQCLRSGRLREVRHLVLTASGGPFLRTPRKLLASIAPEQALKHPIWKMGGRITIDSATLMNKGFEILEAHWLFGFPSAQIKVLIHPQSIIHSMVEFHDGSVVAQLSVPDMRIPIQYALTYPERVTVNGSLQGPDLGSIGRLTFLEPDGRRFPCLGLARRALEQGGAIPCALNAADEVAVEAFLGNRLRFRDIPRVIEKVSGTTPRLRLNSLQDVLDCDQDSRRRAQECVTQLSHRGA